MTISGSTVGVRRVRDSVLLVLFVLCLAFSCFGRTSSSCPPSPNVTTIVYDTDNSSNPLLMKSDDFWGATGYAAYSGALDPNLSSTIYCGKLFLRLYSQSTRTLYIAVNNPVGSQPAGPPAAYYWQNVELASNCFDSSGNQVNLQNVVTSSGNCGMSLDFYANGMKYKLSMGKTCSGCPPEPNVTGLLAVSCLQLDSTGQSCVHWSFVPNMTASSTNAPTVANLFYYSKSGKLLYVGQYYFTMRFEVTNP